MNYLLPIFILACALAADAFSVGASVGLSHREPRQIFRLSFHFGLFQSLLSLSGALVGGALLYFVEKIDHWVAFILLAVVGSIMIYKSITGDEEAENPIDLTRGVKLIGLSVAVSIDAFAAGIGIPAMQAPIVISVIIIGLVSAIATLIAMLLADHVRKWVGKRIEIIAGIVLIILGLNILFSHL